MIKAALATKGMNITKNTVYPKRKTPEFGLKSNG